MVSFLTPFWSGRDLMRIHLRSVRHFHPHAPILVSKRGGDAAMMAEFDREFGVEYWIEECGYTDAYLRLLQRCRTRFACFIDHDAVLLAGVDALVARISGGECDLVGIVRGRILTAGCGSRRATWRQTSCCSIASHSSAGSGYVVCSARRPGDRATLILITASVSDCRVITISARFTPHGTPSAIC